MEELPTNKRYFSISEVAQIFDVSVPKLRFWEENFPTLKIKRNRAGDRVFQQKDLEHLRLIYELVEEKRLTLEGARKFIKNKEHKAVQNADLVEKLAEIRAFLLKLREDIDRSNSDDPPLKAGE